MTSKPCNGKLVSRTKNSGEMAHQWTFRYKIECISRAEDTCRNL